MRTSNLCGSENVERECKSKNTERLQTGSRFDDRSKASKYYLPTGRNTERGTNVHVIRVHDPRRFTRVSHLPFTKIRCSIEQWKRKNSGTTGISAYRITNSIWLDFNFS